MIPLWTKQSKKRRNEYSGLMPCKQEASSASPSPPPLSPLDALHISVQKYTLARLCWSTDRMTLAEPAISTPVILFKAASRPLHHASPTGRQRCCQAVIAANSIKRSWKKKEKKKGEKRCRRSFVSQRAAAIRRAVQERLPREQSVERGKSEQKFAIGRIRRNKKGQKKTKQNRSASITAASSSSSRVIQLPSCRRRRRSLPLRHSAPLN